MAFLEFCGRCVVVAVQGFIGWALIFFLLWTIYRIVKPPKRPARR